MLQVALQLDSPWELRQPRVETPLRAHSSMLFSRTAPNPWDCNNRQHDARAFFYVTHCRIGATFDAWAERTLNTFVKDVIQALWPLNTDAAVVRRVFGYSSAFTGFALKQSLFCFFRFCLLGRLQTGSIFRKTAQLLVVCDATAWDCKSRRLCCCGQSRLLWFRVNMCGGGAKGGIRRDSGSLQVIFAS